MAVVSPSLPHPTLRGRILGTIDIALCMVPMTNNHAMLISKSRVQLLMDLEAPAIAVELEHPKNPNWTSRNPKETLNRL